MLDPFPPFPDDDYAATDIDHLGAGGPPLALLTSSAGAGWSQRTADITAVLEEFGFCVVDYIGGGDDPAEARTAWLLEGVDLVLDHAALLVCDVVDAGDEPPVEVSLAEVRDLPVTVLMPHELELDRPARQMLGAARIVRHDGEPARALHRDFVRRASVPG